MKCLRRENKFVVNMNSYNFRMSLLMFVLTFVSRNVQCDEVLASYSSDYRQAHCEYSLLTGDEICDCRNRNEVARDVEFYQKRKTIETGCNLMIQFLQNFFLPLFNGNINNLRVLNCKNVWVTQNTFQDVDHIGHIHFTNIKELILEPHSLEFRKRLPVPKIKLIFNNVSHSLGINVIKI